MSCVACWARVTRGIEWIAGAEASLLPGSAAIRVARRDLLFRCESLQEARTLRCVDDVYAHWADLARLPLDHTRSSLATIAAAIDELPEPPPMPVPGWAKGLRVTVSMLGRRNYSRFDVEARVGRAVAERLGLPFWESQSVETDRALWCRVHLFDDRIRVGLRLEAVPLHRREWRTEGQAGALHPPVAAAMALLAQLEPGNEVSDPFCGSGTLLIEAALRCGDLSLRGRDIDPQAIHAAATQRSRAGVSLEVKVGDAAKVSRATTDRLLSNPPWGRAVRLGGAVTRERMLDVLLAPLRPGGRAVILADRELQLGQRQGPSRLCLRSPLRVSGRLADLLVIDAGPRFADTEVGRALAHAWKHQRVPP